jgi:ribonuclease J
MGKKKDGLRLVFLGGVGEIGMNCLAVETPQGVVIVDCGVLFPEGRWSGPELAIPDVRYFQAKRDEIAGVVVTHGHEDHIGAIPVIFGDIPVPVYVPPFSGSLIREKTLEYTSRPAFELKTVRDGAHVELAGLEFVFHQVTHSIPDSMALEIRTPAGLIVHTGDFRMDSAPCIGKPFDRDLFGRLGDEGVLLLLSDSTNVERPGRTEGERWVARHIQELVAGCPGRVLISMFSSNVERVGELARIARRNGRRLGLVGRSLYSYSRAGIESGYAPFDPNELVAPELLDELPGRELMVLVAGSQGEPRSSLTRVSTGDHPDLRVREGDMVILSNRMIPGNEKGILRVTNDLVRGGAKVLHEGNSEVHASGHARQDELVEMLELVRPTWFLPVHGEYRFLARHADLAREKVKARTVLADQGSVVTVSRGHVELSGSIETEQHYVEPPLVGSAADLKLKERRKLMINGLVVVKARLNRKRKTRTCGALDVTLYGVPDPDGTLQDALACRLREDLDDCGVSTTTSALEEEIRTVVRRMVNKRQSKKPAVHVDLDGE